MKPRIQDFCEESVLWMHISHPNVLGLIAVDINPWTGVLSTISELMVDGNIMDYIRVNEANRIRLLEDVTRGLQYLHECEIALGDLKGASVYVNGESPQARISGFSFSTVTRTVSADRNNTWYYSAPEIPHSRDSAPRGSRASKQADIYAFGMVIYEVLAGYLLGGEGRQPIETIWRFGKGKRPSMLEKAEGVGFDEGTLELVGRCWKERRDERPTVEEISKHFQCAAKTSTITPPGPTILDREAEGPTASDSDINSGDFGQCLLQFTYPRPNLTQCLEPDRLSILLPSTRNFSMRQSV
ncbi:kinase-like protein [Thelephora ganbajun]|uniref:Kinase-like protein n=1 Tax=Thelephora ganbajun TaxID=370292 RepID=A0ACB6YY86_THEGA|nr:kinase-like protein [Thelephora ganbajun]